MMKADGKLRMKKRQADTAGKPERRITKGLVGRSILSLLKRADASTGRTMDSALADLRRRYYSTKDPQEFQRRVKLAGDSGFGAAFNLIKSLKSPKGACPKCKLFNMAKIVSSPLVEGRERSRMMQKLAVEIKKTSPDAKAAVNEFITKRIESCVKTAEPVLQTTPISEPLADRIRQSAATVSVLPKEATPVFFDAHTAKIVGPSWCPHQGNFLHEEHPTDDFVPDIPYHQEPGNTGDSAVFCEEDYCQCRDTSFDFAEKWEPPKTETATQVPMKKEGFYLSPVHLSNITVRKSPELGDYCLEKGDKTMPAPEFDVKEYGSSSSVYLSARSSSSGSSEKGKALVRSLLEKLKTHGTPKRMGFAAGHSERKRVPEEKKEKPEEKKEKKPKKKKERKKPVKKEKTKEKKPSRKKKPPKKKAVKKETGKPKKKPPKKSKPKPKKKPAGKSRRKSSKKKKTTKKPQKKKTAPKKKSTKKKTKPKKKPAGKAGKKGKKKAREKKTVKKLLSSKKRKK